MKDFDYGLLPTDRGLVLRAMASLRPTKRKPLWVCAMDRFGLGSTYSHALCLFHGYNPDATSKATMKEPTHDQS